MNKVKRLSLIAITLLIFQIFSPNLGLLAEAKSDNSGKIEVKQVKQNADSTKWKVIINASGEENDGSTTKVTIGSGQTHHSINNVGDADVETSANGYVIHTPAGAKTFDVEIITSITNQDQSSYGLEALTTYDDGSFKASDQVAALEKKSEDTEKVVEVEEEVVKAEPEEQVKLTESKESVKQEKIAKQTKEEQQKDEVNLLSIIPFAIGTPGVYTTDPNSIVVPTAIVGESTNAHTLADYLWANGDTVYVAIKSTHELQYMTLNGIQNYDSDVYNAQVPISIDGDSHLPTGLSGNTKDSHWTVFKFNLADLQLPEGNSPFFVKGIGGGHDVGGDLKFTIPKEDKEVKKIWVGGSNHPAVDLQLIAENVDGGTQVLRTGTVNGTESPAWTYTFTDVPMYDPYGRPYTFSADEAEVPVNYDKTLDGLTVTNTYNPEQMNMNVNKEWIGPATEYVTIKLFANGVDTGKTLILNEANDWLGSFTELNKFDDTTGDPIIYTVEELDIPGYTNELSGSVEDGFTFTNTNNETLEIDVEKKWIGPGKDSVTVKLFANGEDTEDTLVLNGDNNWSGTFDNLRKYDEETGEEIVYTVEEVVIPGYSSNTTGSAEDGFIITNTNDETIDVDVEKRWVGPATESVTIKLLASGEDTGQTLILGEDNNWSDTFKNLRKYDAETGKEIIYSVEEVEVPYGYDVDYSTEDEKHIITNTARYGSLTVEKVDENEKPLAGATFELRDSEGNVVGIFTTGNDGTIKFENLEWGDYKLKETKAPEGYNKLVKEIAITINGENLHVTKQVVNTPIGWNIPKTGGIGTLGFYGVGFILIAGAGWFVFRRRQV
ncbi:Cna B-type domain-containing protein [Pseudogracilibacillus auburnensis]|uniref:Cna B-type domain-containing protein n=1 Tax=Pseudogracilibacillus auburnensis TaxID=1494959 RepID=UPI001A96C712|nr:Cna B-type domain-containing protein [Pseudogracilibacillus auburnensis]MBO1003350.1 Cna B-type domain-containing protein [Pseudogracilibacillus auburnensis]